MTRREWLACALGAGPIALAKPPRLTPAIDTHIHLFDTRRAQGVPWPPKDDRVLYRPALPPRYRKLTAGLGVVGAIEVECSPWFEDNQWVLGVAAQDSIIVGTVGNLDPGQADFGNRLEQLHRNPLFRGIRYGNLWDRSLAEGVSKPEVISNLNLLADAGLVMDTANPDPPLLAAVVRLTDQIPSLRVVIDHLPQLEPPRDVSARTALQASLVELGKRPQVYVKISEALHHVDGQVRRDLDFYRSRLDEIWDIFGPDRLLYGSDWPSSDHSAPLWQELRVVHEYIDSKGAAVAEEFFWRNSIAAYRWVKRAASQPTSSAP
ncbi:MAG: amidohydrolase [Acidobacteria bacterium]|nr:MAG: amidohydrolase [Acidobacteriota bacterium]